jgi:CheY-like chemotaxis protein
MPAEKPTSSPTAPGSPGTVSGRHTILVVEDDPHNAEALREMIHSMDMDCRVTATLEETRALLATGFSPCALAQDMQIPHAVGARPHEKAGESCIVLVQALWRGHGRPAIVVVTAFRFDPDYVWQMAKELNVDEFVAKTDIQSFPRKLRAALKARGREDHADCARLSEGARAPETLPRDAARLFSHEHPRGVHVAAAEVEAIVKRRAEHDLFLDYARVERAGYLAGYRDHRRAFRETYLNETSAAIVAQLVEAGRAVRADAIPRLKNGGHASAVRLVQQTRKAVDVRLIVDGKQSRKEWRAIHTVGAKGAMGFVFHPGVGVTWAVIVKGGDEGSRG